MTKAAKSIERGLRQAIAHAKGRKNARPAIIHEVRIAEPDVAAIRARTGLSQAAFAKSIGVAKGTLLNWEQRRRTPDGPARVLLALIDRDPNIVQRALARR
jgi:putative transcriptional regulator